VEELDDGIEGLVTGLSDSTELTRQPMAPADDCVTVTADEGTGLSAVDAARFSRSVFTVRLLRYRGCCCDLFSGFETFDARAAARMANDNVDSVTERRRTGT